MKNYFEKYFFKIYFHRFMKYVYNYYFKLSVHNAKYVEFFSYFSYWLIQYTTLRRGGLIIFNQFLNFSVGYVLFL